MNGLFITSMKMELLVEKFQYIIKRLLMNVFIHMNSINGLRFVNPLVKVGLKKIENLP